MKNKHAVPVLIIVGGDPAASFFVRSVIIWMNDLVVVALIFCPLMHSVHLSSSKPRQVDEKEKVQKAVRHYAFDHSNDGGSRSNPKLEAYKGATRSKTLVVSPPSELPSPPCKGNRNFVSSLTDCSVSKKSVSFNEQVFVSEYELELGASEEDDTESFREQSDRFSNEHIQGTPFMPSRCSTLVIDDSLLLPQQQGSEPLAADPPSVWSTGSSPTHNKEDHNTGPPQMPRRPPSPVDDDEGDSDINFLLEQPVLDSSSSQVVLSPNLPHQDPIPLAEDVDSQENAKADAPLESNSTSAIPSRPKNDFARATAETIQTTTTPEPCLCPSIPKVEPESTNQETHIEFFPMSQPCSPPKHLPPGGETDETTNDPQSPSSSLEHLANTDGTKT